MALRSGCATGSANRSSGRRQAAWRRRRLRGAAALASSGLSFRLPLLLGDAPALLGALPQVRQFVPEAAPTLFRQRLQIAAEICCASRPRIALRQRTRVFALELERFQARLLQIVIDNARSGAWQDVLRSRGHE